ncbi:Gr47b, partial [Drosophila busckii]
KPKHVGFVYCYESLYSLLFYWGAITFRLHHLQTTPQRVIYALSIRIFFIGGFVTGVYIKLSDAQMSQAMFSHLSPVVKIIFSWECVCCIITYIEYCLLLDTQRRRHIRLLANMQLLDTQISAAFPFVNWRYHRTRGKYWYGTVGITFLYLVITLTLMFDTTRCSCGFLSTLVIACSYTLVTSTLGLFSFIHIGLMDYLRVRFRLVMKLLRQLYAATSVTATERELQLDLLFAFAKRGSWLVQELNETVGTLAAAGMFYDFTHMTGFVYVVCQKLLHQEPWDTQYAFLTLHLAVHIYKLIMTCVYGYILQREKRNCMHLLSACGAHFKQIPQIQCRIECFQHWCMHNKHTTTIGKKTPLNLSMLYVVFNGLANYVIVLVQLLFQLQQKDKQSMPKDVEII